MIWAVDGPDKIGKTTALLAAVQDKNYQVYVHSGNWPGMKSNWLTRIQTIDKLGLDAVMDRFFVSELACAEYRGDQSLLSMADAWELLAIFRQVLLPEIWVPDEPVPSNLSRIYRRLADELGIPLRVVAPLAG